MPHNGWNLQVIQVLTSFLCSHTPSCACRLAKCKNLINLKTTKIQPQKIFDFWLEIFGVSKPMFFGIGFQLATLNFGNLCETLTPFRWDSKSFAMFGIPDDWQQLCLWPGLWGKVLEGGDHIRHHWNLSVVWVSHWRQGVGIENHENYYTEQPAPLIN